MFKLLKDGDEENDDCEEETDALEDRLTNKGSGGSSSDKERKRPRTWLFPGFMPCVLYSGGLFFPTRLGPKSGGEISKVCVQS
eukprot:scaffold202677_cov51-Attheya_sp.AAC.1